MSDTGARPGTARRDGRGFATSYGTGRTCTAAGCSTSLSRYNSGSTCYAHAIPTR